MVMSMGGAMEWLVGTANESERRLANDGEGGGGIFPTRH